MGGMVRKIFLCINGGSEGGIPVLLETLLLGELGEGRLSEMNAVLDFST